ncbi:hypothetical protein SISSUDRAFT_1032473 [Sistotremastrum suecicum HHB10207 ss-3]|uniref:Uncharacterized protein n=1 Tax=Sistotremastrum suecicum HHB10207 ss-3 TaxID=1314776 RepID=A0A166EM23_9AGAM|nr:hypothetical protein SISSUDRAFT_1032473 [Sistotremastrum suecicum HHB10207 ss-3]
MAQIDWDGSRPIYVDLGAGDEKLADELFQMAPHSGSSTLVFQTFREVKWELKDSSMAVRCLEIFYDTANSTRQLRSKLLATPLVHYRPHSQLTPDGKLDTLSKSARNRIAKDWLEINVLEYSTIPVAELLVHFLILDEIRKAYFGIEDPAPRPSPAPSETFTQKLKLVF